MALTVITLGCRGYVYALIKDESLDVDVAVRVLEVMIPRCEEEMTKFKQALLNIYELRVSQVA